MSWETRPGQQLPAVIALKVFAILELAGGAWLLWDAKTTSFTPSINPLTGQIDVGSATSEHDWVQGLIYLAAAILIAAFLAGLAQLVEDTHDSRKLLSELLVEMTEDDDEELPSRTDTG